MAENWVGKIIAVIVSGYDGDGAEALAHIKKVGGITIAQKPETAEHPDMPESAIESVYIEFILSPEDIAMKIVEIAHAEPLSMWQDSNRQFYKEVNEKLQLARSVTHKATPKYTELYVFAPFYLFAQL